MKICPHHFGDNAIQRDNGVTVEDYQRLTNWSWFLGVQVIWVVCKEKFPSWIKPLKEGTSYTV